MLRVEKNLTVPSGKHVTIDGSGHKIMTIVGDEEEPSKAILHAQKDATVSLVSVTLGRVPNITLQECPYHVTDDCTAVGKFTSAIVLDNLDVDRFNAPGKPATINLFGVLMKAVFNSSNATNIRYFDRDGSEATYYGQSAGHVTFEVYSEESHETLRERMRTALETGELQQKIEDAKETSTILGITTVNVSASLLELEKSTKDVRTCSDGFEGYYELDGAIGLRCSLGQGGCVRGEPGAGRCVVRDHWPYNECPGENYDKAMKNKADAVCGDDDEDLALPSWLKDQLPCDDISYEKDACSKATESECGGFFKESKKQRFRCYWDESGACRVGRRCTSSDNLDEKNWPGCVIADEGSSLTTLDVHFVNCTAANSFGGAIRASNARLLQIVDSSFKDNAALYYGEVERFRDGTKKEKVRSSGGAISFKGDSLMIKGSHFEDCFARDKGGAIDLPAFRGKRPIVTIEDTDFRGCSAVKEASVFRYAEIKDTFYGGNLTLTNVRAIDNQALEGSNIFKAEGLDWVRMTRVTLEDSYRCDDPLTVHISPPDIRKAPRRN